MNNKLKVGILINNLSVERWVFETIDTIINSHYALVELVIIRETELPNRGFISGLLNQDKNKLASIHIRIDELIFGRGVTYNKKSDIGLLIENFDKKRIESDKKMNADIFGDTDIEEIRKRDLDVILNLGYEEVQGEILNVPRYGVWSLIHRDNRMNNGGPVAYWEVSQNWDLIGSVLLMQNNESVSGKALYRSWSHINSPTISLTRNSLFWKTSLFIPRILRKIYETDGNCIKDLTDRYNSDIQIYDKPSYRHKSNCAVLKNLLSHLRKVFRHMLFSKLISNYSWLILFKTKSSDSPALSFNNFNHLVPPRGKYWADPFVVSRNNFHYIFVEELEYKTWKGHISVLIVDDNDRLTAVKEVIRKPYHLSYPFVFQFENCYYMIPESGRNRTIELYKCKEFPDKWEFVMNLMEGIIAADTTIFFHNKMWWMFTNLDETKGKVNSSDELFLFFSEDLFSNNWVKHPNNPLISDIRFSRPAGSIFLHNGNLYRPSQNNSGLYGRAMNLNLITKLSQTEYSEIPVAIIEPEWDKNIFGTHTLNFNRSITVIDGFYYQSKFF